MIFHSTPPSVLACLRMIPQSFRKVSRRRNGGVIDPPFQLTLFDDNIQWVSVVKYLGLHIDSRLTFKKHIDYLSEKFWRRISLAISLIGRRSPPSLENKVILYKQILRPVINYRSPVWEAAAATHMKKIQCVSAEVSGNDVTSLSFQKVQQTDSSVNYPNLDTLKATEKPQVTRGGRPGKIPDKIILLTLTEVLD
ncbi:RNA-directed DNA polymerase from mobile element jockey [Trichonephila clavipes]|nr:RNA-directed DNA polymerase from mobile element jockey [Trichonephila clavipes]